MTIISWGHKNQTLPAGAAELLSGPYVRDRSPAPGATDVATSSNVLLTIASVLPRTVDLSTVVIAFSINGGAPVTVYTGSAFQSGYSGSATHGSDAIEDFYDFVINPVVDFPSNAIVSVIVDAQDDAANPMSPEEVYSFSLSFFVAASIPAMVPWNRELGDRQARIGLFSKHALGSITVVDGAHLVDGDNFTIDATTFEYDNDGIISIPGAVGIAFTSTDDLETVQGETLAAINDVGLDLDVSAFVNVTEPGVIGLVADVAGAAGNVGVSESVVDAGFSVVSLTGGVDSSGSSDGLESALEGDFVFLLGYKEALRVHRFELGDYSQVAQVADRGSNRIFRVRAIVRAADEMPMGTAWRVSIILDGVEFVGRTLDPGRDRRFVDLAANLSGLFGDHSLAVRLELVST